MKTKRWVIANPQTEHVQALMLGGNYSKLTATVLAARGITSEDAANTHLTCETEKLYAPILLKDMDEGVRIILDAVEKQEKIIVYGDYDVDGITSTCIVIDYLRSIGANCDYYIPNRIQEGYGLSSDALDELNQNGTKLLITVDSGITANEEIKYARNLGMRVVITDHHECLDVLPEANAVINHKRLDCAYPFSHLAGVGVAFKLVCALSENTDEMIKRYADMVALGTVADVMPIISENRILVSKGLSQMAETKNIGLEMLLRESGMKNKRLTSTSISFVIAPRINAAGRMGQAEIAVELFLTKDEVRAQELAASLCQLNKKRQNEENRILEETIDCLRKEYNPLEDKIIVLSGEGWHQGVIGIVCSKLCDRYGCPVILIAQDEDGMGKGSGRSVYGFNLFEALSEHADLLEKYGGHELAAGLTIRKDKIETLKARLKEYAENHMEMADLVPQIQIDCELEPENITQADIEDMAKLEPYGMQNPEPIFCTKDVIVSEITPISSDKHARLTLSKNGKSFEALLFGSGPSGLSFAQDNMVDIAYHLEMNEFRGKRTVQFTLKDVRLSESENIADQKLLNLYNTYMADKPLSAREARILLPNRAELVAVWRHISFRADGGVLSVPSNALSRRIAWENRMDINIGKLFVCLDVFSESKLISYHFKEGMLNIILKPYQGKADISKSVVLATLQRMAG